jgi:hypothetical protein
VVRKLRRCRALDTPAVDASATNGAIDHGESTSQSQEDAENPTYETGAATLESNHVGSIPVVEEANSDDDFDFSVD